MASPGSLRDLSKQGYAAPTFGAGAGPHSLADDRMPPLRSISIVSNDIQR